MMVVFALTVLTGPGNIRDVCIWKGVTIGDLINPHPEHTADPATIVFPEG
jgi:hypothetical protein